jgi:N-glycosylase/DNA lyase
MNLINQVKSLQKTEIGQKVANRAKEFESFANKPTEDWFSELCFCLLTANSKFKTAFAIQKELGSNGFINHSKTEIVSTIRRNKHRFHNNKAKFIVNARTHLDIKNKVQKIIKEEGESAAREWVVKNIKGLGYKEASHFLRNTGCKSLAIIDRHILNLMLENKMIKEKPKTVTKKIYFEIEKQLQSLAKKLNISVAELDLYLWYMKMGDVLK